MGGEVTAIATSGDVVVHEIDTASAAEGIGALPDPDPEKSEVRILNGVTLFCLLGP